MTSVVIVLVAWLLASAPTALLIARTVRRADTGDQALWPAPVDGSKDAVAAAGAVQLHGQPARRPSAR